MINDDPRTSASSSAMHEGCSLGCGESHESVDLEYGVNRRCVPLFFGGGGGGGAKKTAN